MQVASEAGFNDLGNSLLSEIFQNIEKNTYRITRFIERGVQFEDISRPLIPTGLNSFDLGLAPARRLRQLRDTELDTGIFVTPPNLPHGPQLCQAEPQA